MSVQPQPQVDAELEAVLAAARTKADATGKQAITKVAYNHLAMIDLILANPGISQNALAAHFGLTPSWVSQVMVSDAFNTAMAKRREEIIDPLLQATVKQNFEALVARSLDILQQKLNRPANEIPDNLALRALEIGSRAAGYGAKDTPTAPGNSPVEVNIHLEQLGGGLVALLQRKKSEAGALSAPSSPSQGGGDPLPTIAAQQLIALTNDSEEH